LSESYQGLALSEPGTIVPPKSRIMACTKGSPRICCSASRWRRSASAVARRAGESVTHAVGNGRRHAYLFVTEGDVIVNGRVVIAGGEHTGALPGRVLRPA